MVSENILTDTPRMCAASFLCISKFGQNIFITLKKKNCMQCILIILNPPPPHTLFLLTFLKSTSQSPLLPLGHFSHLTTVSSLYPINSRCGAFLSIVNRPAATPVKKNWLSFSQNPPAVHSTSGVGWGSTHQPFHPRMVTGLVLCKQPQLF